jgi:cytidylate kinase
LYFDTGVMYRAVTLAALERGLSIDEEDQITELAQQVHIDVRPASRDDGRQYDVILNGEDITWAIRSTAVDSHVSQVSLYAGVRSAMSRLQREIGMRGDVVMVGRDIGTVVLPEAELKIYLDATVEARARRRYAECRERGEHVSYEGILESMRRRDRIDSTREIAPLKAADDAIMFDSTQHTAREVLDQILELVQDRGPIPKVDDEDGVE